jgi:hypothetical protein
MDVEVRRVEYYSVEAMPESYRAQAHCQIICDGDLAKQIAAQTNIPSLLMLLYDGATDLTTEKILFDDALTSSLTFRGGLVRRAADQRTWPRLRLFLGD